MAPIRRQQLEQIVAALGAMESSFTAFVGDMNLCSSWLGENSYLDEHFDDVWTQLHGCREPGFTEDTQINLMRLQRHKKSKQVRFDRILVEKNIEAECWHARYIDLLGTCEISKVVDRFGGGGELSVFPSDHFG